MLRLLFRLPIAIAGAALFFLMTLTFCDVIMRSAFNAPIQASTELTRLSVAIMVFATLPIISARGEQISVDLLDPLFDRWALARARDVIVNLACGILLFWPTQQVLVLAERARSFGDVTEYLRIPQFLVAYFIFFMLCITVFVLIVKGLMLIFAPHKVERAL
jgi:TRAP-type C4-dicarboxylate transport system permease small subunit